MSADSLWKASFEAASLLLCFFLETPEFLGRIGLGGNQDPAEKEPQTFQKTLRSVDGLHSVRPHGSPKGLSKLRELNQ